MLNKCRTCFFGNRPFTAYCKYCGWIPDYRIGMKVKVQHHLECLPGEITAISVGDLGIALSVALPDGTVKKCSLFDIGLTEEIKVIPYVSKDLVFTEDGQVILNGRVVDTTTARDIKGYVMRGVLPNTRLLAALVRHGFVEEFNIERGYCDVVVNGTPYRLEKPIPTNEIKLWMVDVLSEDVIIFNKYVKGIEKNIKSGRIAFRGYKNDSLLMVISKKFWESFVKYNEPKFLESIFNGCVGKEVKIEEGVGVGYALFC